MKQVRQSRLPGSVHLFPLFAVCPYFSPAQAAHFTTPSPLHFPLLSLRFDGCGIAAWLAWVGGWPKAGRGLPVGLAESGRPQYLGHSYTPCAPRQAKPIRPNTA